MNKLFIQLRKIITLDLRALGLMRIGIGLVIIIDLIIRFSDVEAHYSDFGVLPVEGLFRYLWDHRYVSIYTISNCWQFISLLFLINIFCAVCLMVGYRTRFYSIVCWIFLLSLHNRNPLINQGGDDLLRLVLFIGIFLPWGYAYSLDTTNKNNSGDYSYSSAAGAVYIFQIICMYVFSALLKSSSEWTSEFTGLYYALSLDQILLPFGKLIYPYYNLLLVITFFVYYLELLLPFILLLPVYTNYFRFLFFIIMAGFHLGIVLSLNVGLFPLISFVCSFGILPPFLFDKIDKSHIVNRLKILTTNFPIKSSLKSYSGFPKENIIQSNVMVFFLVCILVINLSTIGKIKIASDSNLNWLIKGFRIDQHWAMFAPAVFKDDGWFVLLGKTKDGKVINIHESSRDNRVDYGKPAYVAATYKSDRWRKYSEGILMVSNSHFRPYYCFYLVNKWNRDHPDSKVNYLEIIYMKEISIPNYEVARPTKEILCNCSIP